MKKCSETIFVSLHCTKAWEKDEEKAIISAEKTRWIRSWWCTGHIHFWSIMKVDDIRWWQCFAKNNQIHLVRFTQLLERLDMNQSLLNWLSPRIANHILSQVRIYPKTEQGPAAENVASADYSLRIQYQLNRSERTDVKMSGKSIFKTCDKGICGDDNDDDERNTYHRKLEIIKSSWTKRMHWHSSVSSCAQQIIEFASNDFVRLSDEKTWRWSFQYHLIVQYDLKS